MSSPSRSATTPTSASSPLPTQGNLPSPCSTRSGGLCVSCPVLDRVSELDLDGWARIRQDARRRHLGCRSGRPISTPSSPTLPPAHASWTRDQWFAQVVPTLRLRIEDRKQDWDPWVAVGELETSGEVITVELT